MTTKDRDSTPYSFTRCGVRVDGRPGFPGIYAERNGAERLFCDLLDAARDAMVIVTRDGRMVAVNAAAVDLFGWHRNELLGRHIDILVPERFRGNHSENQTGLFAQLPSLDKGTGRELVGLCKDHTEVPVEVRVNPLATDNGMLLMAAIRDVSERKRSEESLRSGDRRYRALFENMLEGYAHCQTVFEQDRLRDFVYLETNASFEKLTGLKDVVGRKVSEVIPGIQSANSEIFEIYGRVALTGRPEKLETYVGHLGVWLSIAVYSHAREHFVAVFEDVTARKLAQEALLSSDAEFRILAEAMPHIVWMSRPDGRTVYINRQWMAYTGLSQEKSLGHGWSESLHPDDGPSASNAWQRASAQADTFSIESRLRRSDGAYRWWLIRGVPLKDTAGKILKWFGTCTDIHDLKMAELDILRTNQVLREGERRIAHLNRVYAMLSGIGSLIVRVRDRNELFKEACRVAVEAGGFHMALIGIIDRRTKLITPVASAGKDDEILDAVKRIVSSREIASTSMVGRAVAEKRAILSNDSQTDPQVLLRGKYARAGVKSMAVLPLLVENEAVGILALYAGEREFFRVEEMALLTELSGNIAFAIDHIDRRDRLNYIAYYDELTGLANRGLFIERVAQYIRSAAGRSAQLVVGVLDLERFSAVNHSLGRPAGDALLVQVAAWLTSHLGDASLLARVDADHFAFVLPHMRHERDVPRYVEESMQALAKHSFTLNGAGFRVAAKVGVAVFPDDGGSAEVLFGNAEMALMKAKASGDRYISFAPRMGDTMVIKSILESQLREAIDKEEFILHYQPKVNLVSGKLSGAEALIRWNDPRKGLVPPGRFIPVLEETGLIHEVGRWALHKAIQDYLRWRAAGLPAVRIAVNVSPLQLRHHGFIAEIRDAIGIHAFAAAGLELEITETTIMQDLNHTSATLEEIRSMGIRVAIDDFGTGFSSLRYLAKLPVDSLKIDRSFVADMTCGSRGLALVSTIITLGQALNLKLVAEGVETEEQWRLLQLSQCDEMQGYLVGKPVPRELFETSYLVPDRIFPRPLA